MAAHTDTHRCIEARNKLNAAIHGEGAVIDELEAAVDEACAFIARQMSHRQPHAKRDDCHCETCKPLERPCDCADCRAVRDKLKTERERHDAWFATLKSRDMGTELTWLGWQAAKSDAEPDHTTKRQLSEMVARLDVRCAAYERAEVEHQTQLPVVRALWREMHEALRGLEAARVWDSDMIAPTERVKTIARAILAASGVKL